MGELAIDDVFRLLKPLCDSFVKDPTAEKATTIATLVERTPGAIVQKICENLLYPLTYNLKADKLSKDDNLKLIEAAHAVIKRIRIESLKLLCDVYFCLRTQICQKKNTMELINSHEELKLAVALCLRDLMKNLSLSVIESFYTRQNAALLSHGIYLCVKLARLEKSATLRIAAMDAVMALSQVHDEAETHDVVLRSQIADVIMLFLPGVASGLLEVALGSDIQNHKVTMVAIRAWSRGLTLVMQDAPNEDSETVPMIVLDNVRTKNARELEKMKHILETTKRTSEWYSTVSEKFTTIFTELDTLTKHSHFQVRKELAEGVSLILLKCSRNMKSCFQSLLDILITLSEDENDEVVVIATSALENIQKQCFEDQSMKSALELLEENLYDLLNKLPRIIRTSGESLQIVWLNRLAGYLKILGKQRLTKILFSSVYLRKLLLTLVYIAEIDCSGVSLLEDALSTNYEETAYYNTSSSWKQFKFLFDSTTEAKLKNILKILGELGDSKTLTDSILKMMDAIPKFKKELIFILNTILEVPTDSSDRLPICKQVIENYIMPDFWYLPIKVLDEVSLVMAQHNIIQCCLLLEGVGVVANILQEEYQYFILKTLYLIIERAGSEHSLLRHVGLSTLALIAKSQQHENVGDLFRANVDYISYHVTMKLRRVDRNPGVLDVVSVVTNYSTIDFLPHLRDIVDDLLMQSGTDIQKRNVESFLKVFHAFVICVKRLTVKEIQHENEEYFENMKAVRASEMIINAFMEYYNAKKDSEMLDDDLEHEIDNSEDFLKNMENLKNEETNYENEKETKLPYFISMIRDIMKRCLHFIPSQNFAESCLAMSTLKEGAFILKDWENVLLPIVHELWHPLVNRFENSNPIVINQALRLLSGLAQVSQDFIRSRTLKQIMPSLSKFIKKSCKESYKKDSGSAYKFTQIFKLQREILIQLADIVKNLKLLEKDTWNILEVTEPFLDSFQHPELQEHCVHMYKEISKHHTDIVWIKCVDIWNRNVEPVVPENDLNFWYTKVTNFCGKNNYFQNLKIILTFIHKNQEFM